MICPPPITCVCGGRLLGEDGGQAPILGHTDCYLHAYHCEVLAKQFAERVVVPIPMRITCPSCGELHIDVGEFATKPHHTHSCQHCGLTWRPAVVPTVGVQFLPGFKNDASPAKEGNPS